MDDSSLPRGLRNHNPLNIRKSNDKWQGASPQQTDKSFVTFVSNAYGYRAAFRIIRTYMQRGKYNIIDIIKAWTHPSENNTKSYIRQVSDMSNISQYINIHWKDEETMVALVHSMAIVENGMKYLEFIKEEEIRQGYHLAFG